MYLPMDGIVMCQGVAVGQLTCVILEPSGHRVLDLVVRLDADQTQRLVPVHWVQATTDKQVLLGAQPDALIRQPRLSSSRLVCIPNPNAAQQDGPIHTLFTIYAASDLLPRPADGKLSLAPGDPIHAADGRLGTLHECVLDDADEISHLVLDQSHWYGARYTLIPLDAVAHIEPDVVYLRLTREQVAHLPHRRSLRALHQAL